MTWLLLALAWLVAALGLGWWLGRRLRARRPVALPPPEERPDYRRLHLLERVCPDCGALVVRHVAMAESRCDPCVARRFAAQELADKVEWMNKGWEEKG